MVEEIEAHILKRYELLNKQGKKTLNYSVFKKQLKLLFRFNKLFEN